MKPFNFTYSPEEGYKLADEESIDNPNQELYDEEDDYVEDEFEEDVNDYESGDLDGDFEAEEFYYDENGNKVYTGLTRGEIIYDYLQSQEEEQAEEDYYLQQMQDND